MDIIRKYCPVLLFILCSLGCNEDKSTEPNISDPNLIRILKGHTNSVTSVFFNPSGDKIYSGSRDNTFRIWNSYDGSLLEEKDFGSDIQSMAISNNGNLIAIALYNKKVYLLDADGAQLTHYDLSFIPDRVAFHPTGEKIGVSGGSGKVITITLSNGMIRNYNGHEHTVVSSIAFSSDGSLLATGDWRNKIIIWDVISGSKYHTLDWGSDVTTVEFSFDDKYLISGGHSNTSSIKIWDVSDGSLLKSFECGGSVEDLKVNGQEIVNGTCCDGDIMVWNIAESKILHRYKCGTSSGNIFSVAFRYDREIIVVGSGDSNIYLWKNN